MKTAITTKGNTLTVLQTERQPSWKKPLGESSLRGCGASVTFDLFQNCDGDITLNLDASEWSSNGNTPLTTTKRTLITLDEESAQHLYALLSNRFAK